MSPPRSYATLLSKNDKKKKELNNNINDVFTRRDLFVCEGGILAIFGPPGPGGPPRGARPRKADLRVGPTPRGPLNFADFAPSQI